ncbi:hypothetical protein V9K67_01280 [Paraflavisolibacter sp. H34]|uniref:hypothetical protein n=1 Tax=Huijunlia imazamoxiresistens TaxID=3127457 RepID=UPI0030194972
MILLSDTLTDWLFRFSLAFWVAIAALVLFILLYLLWRNRRSLQRRRLRAYFSDCISNAGVCDSREEVADLVAAMAPDWNRLRTNARARRLFIKELVKAQEDLSGQASDNIVELYTSLGLEKDILEQLDAPQWHRKAAAINQLAALRQAHQIDRIFPETNHRNAEVRDAAQLAIVHLQGAEGLAFLQTALYPITQWQQILLLHQLDGAELQPARVLEWMRSGNATVVEFALRLVEKFMLFDGVPAVFSLLDHPGAPVRRQALQVVSVLPAEGAAAALEEKYPRADYSEQLLILDILGAIGTRAQVPFLQALLATPDEFTRYKALSSLHQLDPQQAALTAQGLQDDPSFTYVLSLITGKEA